MGDRRELRSLAVVMLLIGVVCATAMISCGGGGGGSSNGNLCEQCGDSDGPCNQSGATLSGDDRPAGCTTDPCTVQLRCTRKVDSGQRRCFPQNPNGELDFRYECDGSRPAEIFPATTTPIPTVTLTPSPTVSPISTAPTATSVTPTATGGTPEPTVTATPDEGPEEVAIDIGITTTADELPSSFSATVSYPPAKGTFVQGGAVTCDGDIESLTAAQDDGAGTLSLTFAGDFEFVDTVDVTCTFVQAAGQTLEEGELTGATDPASLAIEIIF